MLKVVCFFSGEATHNFEKRSDLVLLYLLQRKERKTDLWWVLLLSQEVSVVTVTVTEMSIATVTVHSFINLFIDVSGYVGSP